jgi:hypothetical protein
MTNPAKLALGVSLTLVAALGAVTLTRSPPRVLRASTRGEDVIGSSSGGVAACQAGETLPGGVSAIRLWLEAEFGPPVSVKAYSGARVLTEGRRGAGWTASAVTVPVKPLTRTTGNATLCFDAPKNSERLQLYGVRTIPKLAAVAPGEQSLAGRMTIEYLAPGRGSWLSRALTVARHLGTGRAVSGTWLALLLAVVMAVVTAVVVGLAWRELPSSQAWSEDR